MYVYNILMENQEFNVLYFTHFMIHILITLII